MQSIKLIVIVCCLVPAMTQAQETKSSDATLKMLETSPGKMIAFSPTRPRGAALQVNHITDTIQVIATAKHPGATIVINGVAAQSGKASKPVPVGVGRSVVTVDVTAEDGKSKQAYEIKVLREQPTVNWKQQLVNAPWPARDSAGELVFNDRMWLFGGYLPKVVGDIWHSEDGIQWERAGDVPTEAGINIPVNYVYKNRMWVFSNKGELFASADGAKWDLICATLPCGGRYAAGGAVFKDRMWVMGGRRSRAMFNDVWSSTDGVNWTQEVEQAPWSRRQLFGNVVVKDDKLWAIGGGMTVYQPFRAYRDVWSSEDGRHWQQVTEQAPWAARIWSCCAVYRNRIFLLGGFRAQPEWENRDDVWYTADGKHWKQLKTDSIWSARHELSAYVFKDKLWIAAGNSWPLKNDVWSLDIPGLIFLSQPVIEEYVGLQYTYRAEADFNASCQPLHYRLVKGPKWMSVDRDTGMVSGTPDAAGDFNVVIEAADDAGEAAQQSYTLHVQAL